MKDRFVAKRVLNIVLMLFITLLFTVLLAVRYERLWDEITVYLAVDVIFFALFWFGLELWRTQRGIASNRETTFRRIAFGYLLSWGVLTASSFFPEFLKPVLLIAIIMGAFGSQAVSVTVGIFLCSLLMIMSEGSMPELVFCELMILFGSLLAEAAGRRKLAVWYELILLSVSTAMPGLFYYITYREPKILWLFFGALEGLAIDLLFLLFYQHLVAVRDGEVRDQLADLLDKSYPMARELYSFSRADYAHAQRVSRISAQCARLVDADEMVCAVAGFYYRIGAIESGSIAKNGVRRAQKECFPEAVIRIIGEYNGELALPSSLESAIVHMVDALTKKMELFDADTMSSNWNQNMVIYQTLNDFSAQGMYDKSGLSMNMFLKIREYLVKEEILQ